MVFVRFDDLRADRSFGFAAPDRTIEARTPEDVPGLLAAIEMERAAGRWVAGYLSYEAAPAFDANLAVRERPGDDPFTAMPLAWFAVFDGPQLLAPPQPGGSSGTVSRWRPSVPRGDYLHQVERIREHIRDGETYQVNHTIRLRGRFSGSDRAFATSLALAQRGDHCAYLDLGRYRILSASPELFFRIEGDRLITRPMKGTARRGRWPEEDADRAATLRATEKERAENAMIVDLLRNDMGKICVSGTVEVASLYELERYETVWQMTSTVEGRLAEGTGLDEVMTALFPSGSVTGAPKVRSMEVIADLETTPRGVYCGAIGWAAPTDGSASADMAAADFSVAIRTVILDTQTGTAEYGVGSGITYDSDPAREYRECIDKTRVLTTRRPAFDLLETMALRDGAVQHLQEHLGRMAASADYFGFTFDEAAARKAIDGATHGEDLVLRMTCSREGRIDVTVRDLPGPTAGPILLAIDDEAVDPADVLLFHKTTARATYERRSRRHPGADQVVLCNIRGEITETAIANIAVERDGAWVTPALNCGLLPGIERKALLDAGKIDEGVVTVEEFRRAERIAVFNSVRGWQEATL